MTADLAMIQQTLTLLYPPGSVAELRILNTPREGTASGYFNHDHISSMADAAAKWSGQVAGVYATVNPCNPALLARSANRLITRAKNTTSDADIVRRYWLPIDFDAVRPAGISSTDEEHAAALERAVACCDWLHGLGWPAPVSADSGNGGHALYRVDLPNDIASRDLLKRCLEALALYFSDDVVKIDQTTFNASRIWKTYGTLAAKGDNTPDRPHRLARLLHGPVSMDVVTQAQLEALAARVPAESQTRPKPGQQTYASFDLARWIAEHGVSVVSQGPWGNGGQRWILNPCPWNGDHTNKAAFIVEFANGAIAAGCHHNGCHGNNWHALRDIYEPGWQAARGTSSKGRAAEEQPPNAADDVHEPSFPWPQLDKTAYYGLAGDIVRTIEPCTESDSVALLTQLLGMVGNAIGRTPYFPVEADRHYMNIFLCLVGPTSKGRKGTSAGHPLRAVSSIDSAWATRVMGGLSSGEGVIWHVRDKTQGHNRKGDEVCLDEGVSDKRLCILETEFSRALAKTGQDGNVLSAVLRQAWDHGDLRTLVSGRAKAPVAAKGAHISVIAHITADELRRSLHETETANGFANRFLWVCVKRSKLLPHGGRYPEKELSPHIRKLTDAIFHARVIGQIQWDDAAKPQWEAIYTILAEGYPGLLGAVLARAEAQVLRLSCLYALLDKTAHVGIDHLNAAYALWQYCEASARYVFGDRLGDPLADETRQLLRHAGAAGMTRTDLYVAFAHHQKSTDIAQALARLYQEGMARYVLERTPGRPVERWYACSSVHAHAAQKAQKAQKGPDVQEPTHNQQSEEGGTLSSKSTLSPPPHVTQDLNELNVLNVHMTTKSATDPSPYVNTGGAPAAPP
jgi:hypothetical protein